MPDKKASAIARVRDGSIDYQYYAARGMIARNRELKVVAGKVLRPVRMKTHALPALFTIVLLVLVF